MLVIALPAASLADSAGDNQYQDPFANTQPKPKTNTAPTTTPAPVTTTPAPAETAPASSTSTPSADPAATTSKDLPRTGLDLRLVGGLGVLLLAGGLLLRRRLA